MQHVEHISLTTQVLREIRSAIILGDLAPGARLTFRDVAQRLNASVTPVREALLQLVAERVLSAEPGRTITVPILTRVQFLELRTIRVLLEGFAAEAAAKQAEPGLADELEAIHRMLDSAKIDRNPRHATVHNRAFHFRLYEAAEMPALLGMIETIWLRTGPCHLYIYADPDNHVFDVPGRVRGTPLHHHRRAVEALRAGRPADVRRAIEADIMSGDTVILQNLPDDPPGRLQSLTQCLPRLDRRCSEILEEAATMTRPSRGSGNRLVRKRSSGD
jgi:GntR family colanic acid and biofilm gene transcriptional regulator